MRIPHMLPNGPPPAGWLPPGMLASGNVHIPLSISKVAWRTVLAPPHSPPPLHCKPPAITIVDRLPGAAGQKKWMATLLEG